MYRSLLVLFFFLCFAFYLKADTIPTILSGKNIDYAGQIIKVYKYSDYITNTKYLLDVDTVQNDGSFEFKFSQSETHLINVPLGIYEAVLFTEPGKTYQVVLPPNQPKTKRDILNPFYQPVEIYLGIKNIDTLDLNYLIADFNENYHNFIDSNYYYIYRNPKEKIVDSLINNLESLYASLNNSFFQDYRSYKYAWLKYVSYMRDYRYVVREFYHNKPFLLQNPAYMDLFNQLFTNYLTFYMTKKEGERLYSDIAYAKSPTFIKQTFSNNMVLINDTLQELVLLKGLNDEFSRKDFPTSNLLMTLDSVAFLTKVNAHKMMANNIKKKAIQAKVGFPAPQFELRDANGVFRHSKEFLASYVYLNFISIESFSCQQDLELLKGMYEKHKKDFKIVSICIDDDFNKTIQYFNDKGYEWMLLSYRTQKEILDAYKVRSYPSYYLINPDGNLRLAPALTPGENFELQFYGLMQAEKRKQKY